MKIRLFKPHIGREELDNIKDVFERAWLGLGPKVAEFENEWRKYIGCNAALALNSATAALHLSLAAFNFPEGKKVLVPAVTFASTAFAPIYNKLEPVFVDVERDTISISLSDLKKKCTKECVAVMPVHFGGHPAQMDSIVEFAKENSLKVIEDCAHVAGSSYKGKKLGTWGDFGCFSFEEKKLMTTGDGGMLCSNDVSLINKIRPSRWVGIDKDTWKRVSGYTDKKSLDAMHWYYEIALLGYKYNMNDLSASIGLAQLKKLNQMNKKRSECIERYMLVIKELIHIKPLLPYDLENNAYWLFGVRCERREELIIFLKSKGIATGVHYMPLTLHPFFKTYANDCKVSDEIWKTFVTLPLHADLTHQEIDYIIGALCEFDRSY